LCWATTAQAAQMTLGPGESEGGPDNRHQEWLYVVSGTGEAIVNDDSHPLKEGTLLLIEAGDLPAAPNASAAVCRSGSRA
jgi:mannose-6-phosphate isomerase-like protein (cupin superfamily)